ncbi:MAG: beta strand repeat-containing protein [Cellulophaga sp.]
MKINKLLLISFFAMAQYSFGQVKIGNDINTIDSASILELESTDKVLILTRVTNTQMNAITPLTGAMVYNTDEGCMFQYNGILWQSLCNTSSFNQTNTVIFDNNDGTFSYTNENNITVVITKAQLSDNGDGTFSFVNGGGTSINFDGTDNQSLTTDGNPGSLTLENGGSVTINVNDADADDTNELNTDFSLNGTALEITDADGTLSQDLDATFVTEAELTTNNTTTTAAINAVQTDVDNNEAAASTAITALQNDKEDSANKSDAVTLGTSDDLFPTQNAVKTYVDNQVAGSAQVIVSTDADNNVTAGADGGAFYDDAALQTNIATNATNITAETTRATNAENAIQADVDANETAANTAIAAVQTDVDNNEAAANTAIALKEDSANKSDAVTLGTSDDLFPTQNAVKTYVDNQVAGSAQVIVSTDTDNDVTAGADGGAFYDDAALQTSIATNATNITAANTAITDVQNDVDANETAANTAIAAVQTDVDNNEADADAAITAANTAITALQNNKENTANKSDVVTLGTSDDLFPTQNAVKTYVDNQVAGSAQVIVSTDADNDVTAGADGGAFYDDTALQTSIATNATNITAANTAITNVQNDVDANETAANTAIAAVQTDVDNNEADADAAITAANTAITALQNDKENSANKSDVITLGTSDDLFPTQNAVKTYVDNQVAGSAQVIVSTDADNDVTAGADGGAFYDDAALQTSITTNATNITAANTAITNVQNDVDANETAANTAIAAVQTDVDNNEAAANTAIALKENSANKSDVVTLGTSNDLFPTQNAVKTYVDNQVAGSAQVIVSTDADNDVTAGADGGAFYDDAALQTSIATNATNITAETTRATNAENAIQADVDANETAANTAIAAVQTDVDNNEAAANIAIDLKEDSANKSDVVTLGTSNDLFPTQNAVKTYVDNQVAGSAQVIVSTDADNDVTAGADGGAFYDDAALQTSIATNASNITAETTRATNAENAIQADIDANETAANTAIAAVQTDVDNNEAAANTAIALKEDSANKSDVVTLGTSDDLFPTQNAVKTYVDNQVAGSTQVIVSTDADNDVTAGADGGAFYDDAALQTNIATNASNITAANTAITNVQNDVDANETAANTAIAAVQTDVDNNEAAANTAITALQNDKENSANKSDAVTLGTSDDLFPTQNAVKTYVDNQVAGSAQVIVSTDTDNDVTAGADGGAFYDDAALQTSIATNATNITAANTAITNVQNDVDANETAANNAIATVQTDVDNNEAAANTAITTLQNDKEDSANKSDAVTLGTSDDLFPTQNAVKTYVDNQVAGSAQVIVSTDADNDVTAGADGGAFYDDAALQTNIATNATNITAANTAITDVQNDVDANETAANTAIAAVQTDVDNNEAAANTAITALQNDKENSANKSDVVTLGTSDDLFPTQNAVKTYVDNQVAGSAQVIVSTDADNDVTAGADGGAFYDDAALQTNIATNASNITAANTAITNVQNDVDANETAANTAIAAVQTDVDNNEAAANTAIALKEDSANKSDVVTLGTSDDLFPTQNAVKTYVDNQVAGSAQVIVSTDADNDVTAGADGGAFYDDAALQTSIATNATNITAETTRATNAENAIQADVDANETAANTAIAAVQTDVDNNEAAADAAITAANTAITALQNDKENSANKSDVVTLGTSNDLFPTQNAVKTYVDNQVAGSAQVIVSTDADNNVTAGADGGAFYDDAALQTSIATNVTNITAANTAITNVQNDVDANETAANTAIAAVQTDVDNNEAAANTAIALKENSANKSDAVTLGTSDDLFPTQNAVKTYVDTQISGIVGGTVTSLTQDNSTGVISYVNESVVTQTADVISADTGNDVKAGTDGGAFYSSMVKALGKVNALGVLIKGTTGVTVVKQLGVGHYRVNLPAGTVSDANYIIQLSQPGRNGAGNDDPGISYSNQTSTGFDVIVGDNDNGGTDRARFDSEFMFVILDL